MLLGRKKGETGRAHFIIVQTRHNCVADSQVDPQRLKITFSSHTNQQNTEVVRPYFQPDATANELSESREKANLHHFIGVCAMT